MRHPRFRALIAAAALAFPPLTTAQSVTCDTTWGTYFVPSWGESYISADQYGRYVIQHFFWHDILRLYWLSANYDSTLEVDTFFWNYDGNAYGNAPSGYWDSNLPSPYVDTQFQDPAGEKAVTIGSAFAWDLQEAVLYYYMTRMASGGSPMSAVKVQIQRGRRVPSDCYSTWCSFGCDSTANRVNVIPFDGSFYAPGCQWYWYQWYTSLAIACPYP